MKFKILACLGLSFLLLSFNKVAFSQTKLVTPEMPSANALNLGLFTEVPVSLNAGLPNIGVPIYEISYPEKKMSVPISINYHASGFKPEMHPSWVGMGWSLSAGGAINRVIKDMPDELRDDQTSLGFYFHPEILNTSSWTTNGLIWNTGDAMDQIKDHAPDEFHFSFPGNSGIFFLDHLGNWQVQSEKPIKVVFNNNFIDPFCEKLNSNWNSMKTFEKFTLIDEFGVQYVFGGEDAIEYSDELVNPSTGKFTANTWMLKEIIAADKTANIIFQYERGPFQAALYQSANSRHINGTDCSNYSVGSLKLNGKLISPVYLKNISSERLGVSIDFITSKSEELGYSLTNFNKLFDDAGAGQRNISNLASYTSSIPYFQIPPGSLATYPLDIDKLIWLKLDKVIIKYKKEGTPFKTANFTYDNLSNERLRLSKLEFSRSINHPVAQLYKFDYYGTQVSLPKYLQVFGDHWGFLNYNLFAGFTESNFYSFKEPASLVDAVNGTLKSVTYPTGGKTEFEFERHTYGKTVNGNDRTTFLPSSAGIAGGLRVSKITNKSINNPDVVTTYHYVNSYFANANVSNLTSSGILDNLPKYNFTTTGVDYSGQNFTLDIFSSDPVVPLTINSAGQHISYSEVVERKADGAYNIYKYTNHDNGYQDANAIAGYNQSNVPYIPISSRDFERGRLLEKSVYTETGKIVYNEINEYERPLINEQYGVRTIYKQYNKVCVGNYSDERFYITSAASYNYYYPFYLKKIIKKTYESGSGNTFSSQETRFSYQDKLIASSSNLQSSGEFFHTYFSYPADVAGMQSKNMLNYPSIITSHNHVTQVNKKQVQYGTQSNTPNGFYPLSVKEQMSTADPDEEILSFKYDEEGNIIQQVSIGNQIESFQWGNDKTKITAKVSNAQNSTTSYSEPLTTTGMLEAFYGNSTSTTFTSYYTGNVTLAIQLTSPPTTNFLVWCTLSDGVQTYTQNLCFSYGNSSVCGPSGTETFTFSNLPAKTYTLTIYINKPVYTGVNFTYQGKKNVTTGFKEFYYQDFEEPGSGITGTGTPHTGKGYHASQYYTLSWVKPSPKFYVYSYWYWLNNKWNYSGELPYLNNSYNLIGSAFDDIRVYPKDGAMQNFTYDKLLGITSETDAKGKTSYYEYDENNRLAGIRDQDGNIIKYVMYNLKNQ